MGRGGDLAWLVPVGALAGEGVLSLAHPGMDPTGVLSLAALFVGAGVPVAARAILSRGDGERRMRRAIRRSARALGKVAREDPVAAPQAGRILRLQRTLVESWESLPAEQRAMLAGEVFSVVEEFGEATRLLRRRTLLRRHLQTLDREGLQGRVRNLERDISELPYDSGLREAFEETLAGRREEMAVREELLAGVSSLNARIEGFESLLGGLCGELLTLDEGVASGRPDLARIKRRISYFRRSLDEITRQMDPASDSSMEPI
ncbi:hypothetical protein [Rubrobacter calidifluminis]|uniref:hypothetical protein n=1 Tax=Rubrobacter calidifluminis TaxID=1392640 RepID=UPI002361EE8B|nr:hypothetical protein [Rubrobacter calidifluminis]